MSFDLSALVDKHIQISTENRLRTARDNLKDLSRAMRDEKRFHDVDGQPEEIYFVIQDFLQTIISPRKNSFVTDARLVKNLPSRGLEDVPVDAVLDGEPAVVADGSVPLHRGLKRKPDPSQQSLAESSSKRSKSEVGQSQQVQTSSQTTAARRPSPSRPAPAGSTAKPVTARSVTGASAGLGKPLPLSLQKLSSVKVTRV